MGHIDNKDVMFLTENIIQKYMVWYKNRHGSFPKKLDFKSYLSGYKLLCESFDEISGRPDTITDYALRKLFYYSRNTNLIWFNDSTLDLFYQYFSGKTMKEFYKKGSYNKLQIQVSQTFEMEFSFWKDVDSEYYFDLSLMKKVMKLLDFSTMDDEKKTFLIINSVHYGDKSLLDLLHSNTNNSSALSPLYHIAVTGGIREGWRAEYFLSQMNDKILLPFLWNIENEQSDQRKIEKITRIKSKTVKEFLNETKLNGGELATFALQVINQLQGG